LPLAQNLSAGETGKRSMAEKNGDCFSKAA
jgi:hypothetical protein